MWIDPDLNKRSAAQESADQRGFPVRKIQDRLREAARAGSRFGQRRCIFPVPVEWDDASKIGSRFPYYISVN